MHPTAAHPRGQKPWGAGLVRDGAALHRAVRPVALLPARTTGWLAAAPSPQRAAASCARGSLRHRQTRDLPRANRPPATPVRVRTTADPRAKHARAADTGPPACSSPPGPLISARGPLGTHGTGCRRRCSLPHGPRRAPSPGAPPPGWGPPEGGDGLGPRSPTPKATAPWGRGPTPSAGPRRAAHVLLPQPPRPHLGPLASQPACAPAPPGLAHRAASGGGRRARRGVPSAPTAYGAQHR